MITDKLGTYAAARRQIMPEVEHRSHKRLNNRAECGNQVEMSLEAQSETVSQVG